MPGAARRGPRGRTAGRQCPVALTCGEVVDLPILKQCWLALPIQDRLARLRFTDAAVVEQAKQIHQALYDCELRCYQHGINSQYDGAGQRVVANGLRYFKLEPSDGQGSEPCVLSATREFVEAIEIFAYMEHRLGRLLHNGVPALRAKSLASTFEPTPNTWTDFEVRILRIVEKVLYELSMETLVQSPSKVEPAMEEHEDVDMALANILGTEPQVVSKKPKKARKSKRNQQLACVGTEMGTSLQQFVGELSALDEVAGKLEAVEDDCEDSTRCGGSACGLIVGHSRSTSQMSEVSDGISNGASSLVTTPSHYEALLYDESSAVSATQFCAIQETTVLPAVALRWPNVRGAWRDNGLPGDNIKWHFLHGDANIPSTNPGTQHMVIDQDCALEVSVKRTFLELGMVTPTVLRRAKSCGDLRRAV